MAVPVIKDREIIRIINKLLGLELAAAAQFRLHARVVSRRGDKAVSERLLEMASEEDRHATILIDVIDASDMRPTTRPGPVYWPSSPLKILVLNRKNELVSIRAYEKLVDHHKDDKVLRGLWRSIIREEKRHIRTLDKLIKRPID
jgi:bacterioferritin (cytochrome b1)